MRTYYDPEDDTGEKIDRSALREELADLMYDQLRDAAWEAEQDTFTASSDAAETSPVAMLPADAITTLWGVGDGDAAGGEPISKKARHEYSQTARALLTRCFNKMSGREINACQIATGDFDTDEPFRTQLLDSLAIQYSREIAEHIDGQGRQFTWDFDIENVHHVYKAEPLFVSLEVKRAPVLMWLKELAAADEDVIGRAALLGIFAYKKPVVSSKE